MPNAKSLPEPKTPRFPDAYLRQDISILKSMLASKNFQT